MSKVPHPRVVCMEYAVNSIEAEAERRLIKHKEHHVEAEISTAHQLQLLLLTAFV